MWVTVLMIIILPKAFDLKPRRSLSWHLFVYSFAHSTSFSYLFIYVICFLLLNSCSRIAWDRLCSEGKRRKKKGRPFRAFSPTTEPGPRLVSNANRTEWSFIRFVIIRVINKIGRLRSDGPICLITSQLIITLTKFVKKRFFF